MKSVLKPTRPVYKRGTQFRYAPGPDITSWELARFIAILVEDKPMHFERFFAIIPEDMQRHFRHTKNG